MGGGGKVTVGYHYYFGVHMGLSRGPIDELLTIRVADRIAWEGSITNSGSYWLSARELFGGESGEGGVEGWMDVMMGTPDQVVNPRLQEMQQAVTPAFRGVCTIFFDGLVTSINPYPKQWSFRARRALEGWDGATWYPERAVIALDEDKIRAMNPAHIIYESLTNRDWGRGLSRQLMGDSWATAADVLHDEGFGLCLLWSRQTSINDFIQHVADHIGANIVLDPYTGLMEIGLVRDNYTISDLPLFTPDTGLLRIDDDEAAVTAVSVNEIIVVYRDPVTNEDGQVRVQNLAAIQGAGGVLSQTLQYPGIPTAELAARVAQRELRMRSAGIKRFTLSLDRRGHRLLPGDVIRIGDPRRGITEMVVRIGTIEYGTVGSGRITAQVVQDVFGLPATSYVSIQPPGWVPPSTQPQPLPDMVPIEIPYRDLIANGLSGMQPDSAYLATLVARPAAQPMVRSYLLQARPGMGEWVDGGTGDFCPTAVLADDMPVTEMPVTINVLNPADLDLVDPGTAVFLNDEILRVVTIDPMARVCTLARGCVDTTPRAHAAGSRIWFYNGDFAAAHPTEWVQLMTVECRVLSQTSSGMLDPALAPIESLVMTARQDRPYPPGRLRINGVAYPSLARGVLRIEWAHRNRILQADQVVDTAAVGIEPEIQTVYQVTVRRSDTQAILSSAVTDDDSVELDSAYSGLIDIAVNTLRGDFAPVASMQRLEAKNVNYVPTGWGNAWGLAYGGTRTSGVIVAERGEVKGSRVNLQNVRFTGGKFIGMVHDPENLGSSYFASSLDAETWMAHPRPPGNVPLELNGTWLSPATNQFYFSESLDGPWVAVNNTLPHVGHIGYARGFFHDGDRFYIAGRDGIYALTTEGGIQRYPKPAGERDVGEAAVGMGAPACGAGAFVCVLTEGYPHQDTSQPRNTSTRVLRSTDLYTWENVTPADLRVEDGRMWFGSVQYVGGYFWLMARKFITLTGGDTWHIPAIYRSVDGITWTETVFTAPPGVVYRAIVVITHHQGRYYAHHSYVHSAHWDPVLRYYTSPDGLVWTTHIMDHLQTYPRSAGGQMLSTPMGLMTNTRYGGSALTEYTIMSPDGGDWNYWLIKESED